MPTVILQADNGQNWRLDTLDFDKVGPWLQEWIPLLVNPNYPGFPRLEIWPIPLPGTGKPDLPREIRHAEFTLDGAVELGKLLIELAKMTT